MVDPFLQLTSSTACCTVTIAAAAHRSDDISRQLRVEGGRFEIQQAAIAEIHMDTRRARSKNTPIYYAAVFAFCVLPLRS